MTKELSIIFTCSNLILEKSAVPDNICHVIQQNQWEVGNIGFQDKNKGEHSVCFSYCFRNSSSKHTFVTNCPISMGFSGKCSITNALRNHVRNRKLNMPYFRLILLDRITFSSLNLSCGEPIY